MTRRGEDGFILVAVLWLVAALAALASAYAVYAVETAPSVGVMESRLQAEAALRAGVELAAYRQLAWPKAARPDGGAFSAQVGRSRVDVVFRSENARVDLNTSPRELLAGLFAQIGAPKATANFLADRVEGWRKRLDDSDRIGEAAVYRKAGLAYGPLGAPFDNALEIALLPGMTPALVERALPFITIFGAGHIDPRIADPVVLAALPGATPGVIKGFLAARNGPPPKSAEFAALAGPVKDFVTSDPSEYVRVEIEATVADRRIRAEAVLRIHDGGRTPFDVLYWRDDFDGAAGDL